ncbi:MAG: hypothetical protein EOL88_11715 [Bacteroidia bacterium]|nr:hypothetical protein [Bacteroidia bacterium]
MNTLKNRILRLWLIITILLPASYAFSQINSPYSNFGLGNLQSGKSIFYNSMGGIGIGMGSDLYINPSNPATYAAFDTLSFVFDMGVYTKSVTLNTIRQSESYNNAGIDYITFAFPIARWWKTSLGLLPYSQVNYAMNSRQNLPGVGNLEYNYEGSGGINKFYWGHAVKFGNENYLSLGANVSYLFGTVTDKQSASFPDSVFFLYTKNIGSLTYKDLCFDFGAYFNYEFGKDNDYVLGLGAVYALGENVNASRSRLTYTYILSSLGVDYIKDTLYYVKDLEGTVGMPQTLGAGFSFKKKNKYHFGADVEYRNWEDFHIFTVNEKMENSLRFAAGGQFMPGGETVGNYWNWVRYRAGFYYHKSALQIEETAINEFGITFGIGMPLRRSRSTINLGFEIGSRGTSNEELIKETFFNFRLGFSIYENWFIKQKFN